MLSLIAGAALSLLQIKSLTFACWAEMPSPDTIQLTCGMAVDGKVIDGIQSPVLQISGMAKHELAAVYCSGIYSLLGTQPPVETKI